MLGSRAGQPDDRLGQQDGGNGEDHCVAQVEQIVRTAARGEDQAEVCQPDKVDFARVAVPIGEGIVEAEQAGENIEESIQHERAAGKIQRIGSASHLCCASPLSMRDA